MLNGLLVLVPRITSESLEEIAYPNCVRSVIFLFSLIFSTLYIMAIRTW